MATWQDAVEKLRWAGRLFVSSDGHLRRVKRREAVEGTGRYSFCRRGVLHLSLLGWAEPGWSWEVGARAKAPKGVQSGTETLYRTYDSFIYVVAQR